MPEDVFEKWRTSHKRVASLGDVISIVSNTERGLIALEKPWSSADVRDSLEKKFGTLDLSIEGTTRIAKGENPAVGITREAMKSLEVLYDFDYILGRDSTTDFEVRVLNPNTNSSETGKLVQLFIKSESDDVVISHGLAEKLKLKEGDEVRILDLYQKLDELNLDDY